jgi:hypothetical protein
MKGKEIVLKDLRMKVGQFVILQAHTSSWSKKDSDLYLFPVTARTLRRDC